MFNANRTGFYVIIIRMETLETTGGSGEVSETQSATTFQRPVTNDRTESYTRDTQQTTFSWVIVMPALLLTFTVEQLTETNIQDTSSNIFWKF